MKKLLTKIIPIVTIYWAIYGVFSAFIEPFTGWFGVNYVQQFGVFGQAALYILPAAITFLIYIFYIKREEKYLGVTSVSIGKGRSDAFQEIRERANHNIFIVGIGMRNITHYAKQSLAEQATRVPIDILMIDPDVLERNNDYAKLVESFFEIKDFSIHVRNSFETLKEFCLTWNSNKYNKNKIRLRVYDTLPTASVVIIDTNHDTGEAVIEFFISYSGERRPRLLCENTNSTDKDMFAILREKYITLWNNSKKIVE